MTEEIKTAPEAAEAIVPEQSKVPEAAPAKKSPLKLIFVIVAVLVLMGLLVLGCGFVNGYRVKSYAKKAEFIYNGTKKWNEDDLNNSDFASSKTAVKKVADDSAKYLNELNAIQAPGQAKTLDTNLKEYFTKSKKVADYAFDLMGYLEQIERISKIYSDSFSSTAATTPEAMVTELEQQKTQMQQALADLDKINVPESMKVAHASFRKMIADTIPLYDQMITALRANDLNGLMNVSTSALTGTAEGLESVNPETSLEKDLGNDTKRLNELEKQIPAEITKLKGTNFTFQF